MLGEWINVDWASLFAFDTSPLEIFVRGTVMFFALFVRLHLMMKRQMGGLGVSDLLVVVLIADAVGNGMTGDYTSVSDSVLLVLTLVFWNYALNWLDYYVPGFRRIFRSAPLQLIKDGHLLRHHMQREFITIDELTSQLPLQGVDDVKRVREACLEADGRISVVTEEDGRAGIA